MATFRVYVMDAKGSIQYTKSFELSCERSEDALLDSKIIKMKQDAKAQKLVFRISKES